jgi:acyl carrier protein
MSSSGIEWYNRAQLTETQQKIFGIWKEILGEDAVFGIHDKFFEAGGNSITVLKMLERLNSEFDIEFNIGELFDCATVYKIAEYIDRTVAEDESEDEIENISF